MKRYLLIAMLTACGADPETEQAANQVSADKQNGGIEYQPDAPKEVVVEYRKDGSSYAITVSDTSELPACTRANSKQLAWVKTTEQFFSCEDEAWLEIEMQQPKAGADGVGTPGVQGPKGDKGDPGQPVTANQWYDPITDHAWLIGGAQQQAAVDASTPCANGWRLSTMLEAKAAIQHGLSLASADLGGSQNIWTSEFQPQANGSMIRWYVSPAGQVFAGVPTNPTAAIACLRE